MEQKVKLLKLAVEPKAPRVSNKARPYHEGIADGRLAAVRDYTRGTIDLETFENRDFGDKYGIGFELGYLTKLAEILAY